MIRQMSDEKISGRPGGATPARREFQAPIQTELAESIRVWVRANMPQFPSDAEMIAHIGTLMERAANAWFRMAPLDQPVTVNKQVFLGLAQGMFEMQSRGHLETRCEPGGFCHFLDGRQLKNGDQIEIEMVGGRWEIGQYMWSTLAEEKPCARLPTGEMLEIIPGSKLRWPAKASEGFAN